jgi:DNA repair exonuclease SbcCD ATPase subunit
MTKATADAIINEKQRESLYEIRAGLMDLQEKVLEDQQSRMELLAQLEAITKERDSLKEKKSRLNKYELFAVGPARHVYRAKANEGAPEHFACPNCIISAGNPSVLQVERGYGNDGNESRYWCTLCTFQIFV